MLLEYLSAADGDDYLQCVTFSDSALSKLTARHDLPVALDGDALARKPKIINELRERHGCGELTLLAVEGEGDHAFGG